MQEAAFNASWNSTYEEYGEYYSCVHIQFCQYICSLYWVTDLTIPKQFLL